MSEEQSKKYYAIAHWPRLQPDEKLRNKNARLRWVKDHTDREEDPEFRRLTFYQRALLEGMCRLAGRTPLRTIYADSTYISRALHAAATDLPHVRRGLATLVSRGFLIPTDNEKFFSHSGQKRGGEGEGDGEVRAETEIEDVSVVSDEQEQEVLSKGFEIEEDD